MAIQQHTVQNGWSTLEPQKKACDALDKASENGKGKKKGLERAKANNNC